MLIRPADKVRKWATQRCSHAGKSDKCRKPKQALACHPRPHTVLREDDTAEAQVSCDDPSAVQWLENAPSEEGTKKPVRHKHFRERRHSILEVVKVDRLYGRRNNLWTRPRGHHKRQQPIEVAKQEQ